MAEGTRWETLDSELIVNLPSGTPFPTMNDEEAAHVRRLIDGYLEMRFDHTSDLSELDRLVSMELLVFRYTSWLALGETYNGAHLDPKLNSHVKELSLEIRTTKGKLGIDKVNRDRARGEGSLHQRITALLQHARAFEIHRCDQVELALELMNQLISLTQLHVNLREHEDEQREMGVTAAELIDWIWEKLRPQFEQLDEHFRDHVQRMWHMEDARLEALR